MKYRAQACQHFYNLCNQYRELLRSDLATPEAKRAFIICSLRVHAARGNVPQRLRSLPNRILREVAAEKETQNQGA